MSINSTNIYRIGGIACLVGIVFFLGYYISPVLLGIGMLAFCVFIYALFRLFSAASPVVSLVAAVLGIAGSLLVAYLAFFTEYQNNTLANTAIWLAMFVPPLIFGFLGLQSPALGMPRILSIIAIISGVAALINWLLTLMGGGDWSNPNNPALGPWIMGSYYIAALLGLVWLVWTSIVLLRKKG
jgi:hypothetical protein